MLSISILLGNSLGMKVIAEGVETVEQLEMVHRSGGHLVQGYYFARPMSFAACSEWLVHPSRR